MNDLRTKTLCNHKLGDLVFSLNECPRCNGTGVYFDVGLGVGGDLNMTDTSNRLLQDVEKALLEQVGSNIEDAAWGSALYAIPRSGNFTLTKGYIVSSIVNALSHLRDLLVQEDFDYTLPLTEKIHVDGIKDLKIISSEAEPRKLTVQISVFSESYIKPLNVTVPIYT